MANNHHPTNNIGYYAAQDYKNARMPIPLNYQSTEQQNNGRYISPFLDKMELDEHLYHKLWNQFVFRQEVMDFMKEHHFHNHTVLGLHIQAVNGEQDHFVDAN